MAINSRELLADGFLVNGAGLSESYSVQNSQGVIFHAAEQPLTGTLSLRPDIDEFTSQDDLDIIQSFLRHDGTFSGTPLHANGRNVTIPLQKMLLDPYDSIQVSGGAYIPMGVSSNTEARGGLIVHETAGLRDIYPPAQTANRYKHAYSVVEDGAIERIEDSSPLGSYNQELAERKIANTARAGRIDSNNLITPVVLGKYEYEDLPDGMGGNATAILFGVPFRGLRADQAYAITLFNAVNQRSDLLMRALDMYMPPIMQTLGMIGTVASDIHAAGMVHNQLTLGNVLPIQVGRTGSSAQDILYVADWETADELHTGDEMLLRGLDLAVAFRSFSGGIERTLSAHPDGGRLLYPILLEGLMLLLTKYSGVKHGNLQDVLGADRMLWLDSLAAMQGLYDDVSDLDPVLTLLEKLSSK